MRFRNHQDLFSLIYSKLFCNNITPQNLFWRTLCFFDVCRCHTGKQECDVSIAFSYGTHLSTEDIWAVLLRNNNSTNNLPLRRGRTCHLCWNHSRRGKHEGKCQSLLFVVEHFPQGSPGVLFAKPPLGRSPPHSLLHGKIPHCSSGQDTEKNHLYTLQALSEAPAMYIMSVFSW